MRIHTRLAVTAILGALLAVGACTGGGGSATHGAADHGATTTVDPVARTPVTDGGDLGAHKDAVELTNAVRALMTAPPPNVHKEVPRGCVTASRPASGGGVLVYSASLAWQGEGAVALGYHLTSGSLPYRLVVMSRPACRLLVVQSFGR